MTARSFNDLLNRIQQGDMSALQPIYLAYYKSMCNQALGVVHSRADAEDIASESMLKLVKFAQNPSHANVKDCGAFLYTLTHNTALDFVRKQKRVVQADDDRLVVTADEKDNYILHEAIRTLPEQDYKIAQMFYFYDCKIKTIASELGMSVSAVKWHLSDIRKKLYDILKNN